MRRAALPAKHTKDIDDVPLRTGEQIVILNYMPARDG
jgi:hypothetical protein